MIKARGSRHINLNVRDINRSLKFYQDAFGLEVKFWEGKKLPACAGRPICLLHRS